MTVYFSQGPAISKKPTAADLLDCLASDASTVENARDFNDFCSELGYDTDSRKAERLYKVCQRQAEKLKAMLGETAYQTLLYETERQ